MSRLTELEKTAIQRFRAFEPEDGYYLAYSGGKDSDCIKILAQLSGVKFEAVHNLTTVDAPETVSYIKSQADVKISYPHTSMWELIVKKGMPPTRLIRYCCEELKERGGIGKLTVTGVRWAESTKRKESSGEVKIIGKPVDTQKHAELYGVKYQISKQGGIILNDDNDSSRRLTEYCYRTRKTMLNPIIDWNDGDVWSFLRYYKCQSNPLYQCGQKRIGCIGCPMQGPEKMKKEFSSYPVYKQNYIKAFERMVKKHSDKWKGRFTKWETGQDVFDWWTSTDSDQITFDQILKNEQ